MRLRLRFNYNKQWDAWDVILPSEHLQFDPIQPTWCDKIITIAIAPCEQPFTIQVTILMNVER